MANFAYFQFLLLPWLFRLKDFLHKIFLQNLAQNATIKSRKNWMKEEQERPKIKLKVRQIDENLPNSFDESKNELSDQVRSAQDDDKKPAQKIIIRKPDAVKNEKDEKAATKRTIFQICAIVLTILLAIAIVVEIFVMVGLKNNTDNLKNKNDKLPQVESSISMQI